MEASDVLTEQGAESAAQRGFGSLQGPNTSDLHLPAGSSFLTVSPIHNTVLQHGNQTLKMWPLREHFQFKLTDIFPRARSMLTVRFGSDFNLLADEIFIHIHTEV